MCKADLLGGDTYSPCLSSANHGLIFSMTEPGDRMSKLFSSLWLSWELMHFYYPIASWITIDAELGN